MSESPRDMLARVQGWLSLTGFGDEDVAALRYVLESRAAAISACIKIYLHGDRPYCDHACRGCVPDGDMLVPGFLCGFHSAVAIARSESEAGA